MNGSTRHCLDFQIGLLTLITLLPHKILSEMLVLTEIVS